MRPGAELNASGAAAPAMSPSSATSSGLPRSSWHSPVPYLFGALAAMLGLIGFALLILSCSYWKLAGNLEAGGGGDGDGEDGVRGGNGEAQPGGSDAAKPPPPQLFEESIVVIMAGDCKPTFLATPIASRAAPSADEIDGTSTGAADADGKKRESAVTSPESDVIQRQSDAGRGREQGPNQ